MKTTYIFIVFCGCFLLGGCNKNLTREKATELIKDFYDYPNLEIEQLSSGFFSRYSMPTSTVNGKMVFRDKERPCIQRSAMDCYLPNQTALIVSVQDFFDVTGITDQDEGTKLVKFGVSRQKVSKAGKCLGYSEGEVVEREVTMKLYDDGWRIEEKEPNTMQPTNYSYLFK